MNENQIALGVYRDLENRRLNEPDDSPRAREAHEKRRCALETDLAEPWITVLDWGDTKDARPHEYVEVLVGITSNPAVHAAVVPAAAFIGGVLADAFKSKLVDGLKNLIPKLISRIRNKDIQDVHIRLPDNSTVQVGADSRVTLRLQGGKLVSFEYDTPPAV
jgi:hypothetical protein